MRNILFLSEHGSLIHFLCCIRCRFLMASFSVKIYNRAFRFSFSPFHVCRFLLLFPCSIFECEFTAKDILKYVPKGKRKKRFPEQNKTKKKSIRYYTQPKLIDLIYLSCNVYCILSSNVAKMRKAKLIRWKENFKEIDDSGFGQQNYNFPRLSSIFLEQSAWNM